MGNKEQFLYGILTCLNDIAECINNLNITLKDAQLPTTMEVRFDRVVWLDATGEYVLIWYADGTGQVLHCEGKVATLSTVAQNGKTLYKLSNGKELLFDRNVSKSVYP